MSLRYPDKVVIVTGGSKGIGRGIVKVFVENGAKVVFCARGGAAGEALEAELNKTGPGSCKFVTCDISKEDDIKRLVDVTVARHGHVDCLVNNAGWHPPHKSTDDVTAQEFLDLLNLNVVSYFLASKVTSPPVRAAVPTAASRKHHQRVQSGGDHRSKARRPVRGHQGGDHIHDEGDGRGRECPQREGELHLSRQRADAAVGGTSRTNTRCCCSHQNRRNPPAAGAHGHRGGERPGRLVPGRGRHFLHRDRPAAQRRSRTQLRRQESDPHLTVAPPEHPRDLINESQPPRYFQKRFCMFTVSSVM